MSDPSLPLYPLGGIRIIASADIPNGSKRTVGDDIFVSTQNYAYLRDMSAKGVLIMLAILKERTER